MCMCAAYQLETTQDFERGALEGVMQHAGELTSERMRKTAADICGYIWKYREGKDHIGVCSRCKACFDLPEDWRKQHKVMHPCPVCGREAFVMDAWRGRKYLVEKFYLAEWRKSRIDDQVLVMVAAYCELDLNVEHPEDAQPRIVPHYVTAFRYGEKPISFSRRWRSIGYWGVMALDKEEPWSRRRECKTMNSYGMGGYLTGYCPQGWLGEALKGTRFEQIWKALIPTPENEESGMTSDGSREMEIIAKTPMLEYLIKMGQAKLARERLHGPYDRKLINQRGKTAQDVLKLDGQQLQEVKRDKIELTTQILGLEKLLRKHNIKWCMKEIAQTAPRLSIRWPCFVGAFFIEHLQGITDPKQKSKFLRYAAKVGEHQLRDYWRQMEQLRMDMTDEQLLYPKNFDEAHQRLTDRIQCEADEKLNVKISEWLKELDEYRFEHGNLLMRPFEGAKEIVDEGNALHHCVGGYARRYAEGGTILCALRRIDAPDVPYRTIEFSPKTGAKVQCRGLRNQSPPEEQPEINAFFEAFEAHRVGQKNKRRKSA